MNKTEQYIESADGSFHHVSNIKQMIVKVSSDYLPTEGYVGKARLYDGDLHDLTPLLKSLPEATDALIDIMEIITAGVGIITFNHPDPTQDS